MNFELSPKETFCSFDGKEVFEFRIFDNWDNAYTCDLCAFRSSYKTFEKTDVCLLVPCNELQRADKNNGFWQKSKLIDYQAFTKMLRASG